LQQICNEVIQVYDITVLEGYRDKERQNYYFKTGASKLRYPQSRHNSEPSLAVDIAPWPINWTDINRFYFMAGHVFMAAHKLGVRITWGGDWDGDKSFKDNKFNDLPHFEYRGEL
jgi:peptidoglycan L-alanyl-D-glutamate endopeptidase CwlK